MMINMRKYGTLLIGHDYGKQSMAELHPSLEHPVELDFSGVTSLGSSFGDEVVPVIAQKQGNQLTIIGPNNAAWDCLLQIAEEYQIKIVKK